MLRHRGHGFPPADAGGHLLLQALLEQGCIAATAGIAVAQHRDPGIAEADAIQRCGEGLCRLGHEGGVKCSGNRQGNSPFALERLAHALNRVRLPRDHHLGVAVVVGDAHPFGVVHQRFELAAVEADHGGHRAATGGRHQFRSGLHQLEARFQVEHAGGIERHQFPKAVASHKRSVAPLLDQVVHQQGLHDEQGWLRVAGVVEVVGTAAATAVALADGQQITAQQLGGHGEALAGAAEAEHRIRHAQLL